MPFECAAAFRKSYPHRTALMRHRLVEDPRLALPALAALAGRMPSAQVEYYPGDAFSQSGPTNEVSNGLSAEETVRRILECDSWLVIKDIGRDAEYAPLMEHCFEALEPDVVATTGAMHMRVGFVFVSSPGAVVPLHWDPEHNVLMQVRGSKRVSVFPDPSLVPAERHESYHVDQAEFKLARTPDYDACEEIFHLTPGDALHIPLKAPHAVVNDGAASISFSVTWRSEASDRDARLHRANHAVRAMGGRPPEPGSRPLRDRAAVLCQRAVSRLRTFA